MGYIYSISTNQSSDGEMNMDMDTKRRGLIFLGTVGSFDVYEYFKGDRPIFEAAVDTTDPELTIHVGRIGATWAKVNLVDPTFVSDLFATKGHARWSSEDPSRISGLSVRQYIRPRAFSILANLFVTPKTTSENTQGQN